MDWVLNHLNLLLVVAALVASWMANQRKKRGDAGPASRQATQMSRPQSRRTFSPVSPPPLDDEVRRVQEEIRRKILERVSGRKEPVPPPPPIPAATRAPQVAETPPPPPEIRRVEAMQAEIARLEEERRARKETSEDVTKAYAAEEVPRSDILTTLGLQEPENLRRAVLLSEILGRPVALR